MAHEVNRAAAIAFVEKNGNAAEHARLRFGVSGLRPTAQEIARLFDGQRDDGGFEPFWAPDYSSLDATCHRLAQADQLGLISAQPIVAVARAIDFIALRQARDGSFEEDASVAGQAPPWVMPGDPAAQVYLTANCGFWLAIGDRLADAANAAGRFLHNQIQKGDALASYMHANWLAAGLWHQLGWLKPFDYMTGYLSAHLDEQDGANLAWLMAALLRAGVPRQHALVQAAAARLCALQQPDGRWVSADGEACDVHVTLEALFALDGISAHPRAHAQ